MTGGPAAAERPRTSPLLAGSLVLSAVSLALPTAFGPVGPLAAGVLAFLGYRKVRASQGAVRGPRLAQAAMTVALLLFVLQAWAMVRHAATTAAWAALGGQATRVDGNLRTGTPEGAFELLSPEAQASTDRAAFVTDLREALSRLGPLETLGEAREAGGDWERTGSFEDGEEAELRLAIAFDAKFRKGRGRVEVEVLVRRRGRAVTSGITALTVVPVNR